MASIRLPNNQRTCSVTGCANPLRQRSLCNTHYIRFRVYGDVHYSRRGLTLGDRFWSRVDKNCGVRMLHMETDCWEWTGTLQHNNYGRIIIDKKQCGAHRVSFFLHYGKWPMPQCCHHCDNPKCVNPDHLFEGTAKDNNTDRALKGRSNPRRGQLVNRTSHCNQGHEWTLANTLTEIDGKGRERRRCRTCSPRHKYSIEP